MPFPIVRYVGSADELELRLLDDVRGPVLDVGCGPGRHLRALSARGVRALGIDLSPAAVALARGDGSRAVVADIFGQVPGSGSWRTALLLDGNIGIGGDPVRLLQRLRSLLSSDGVGLVELEPPGLVRPAGRARLELGEESSGWFPWARVAAGEVATIAAEAGMTVEREWSCAERWFARLRSPTCA
jgi:SAM-dependent methyltransferase